MPITVVGSVAYDSVETPSGRYDRMLAGAATYFSLAASFFAPVRVIAVVGEDFGPEQEAVFKARGIDIQGIEHAPARASSGKALTSTISTRPRPKTLS